MRKSYETFIKKNLNIHFTYWHKHIYINLSHVINDDEMTKIDDEIMFFIKIVEVLKFSNILMPICKPFVLY